MIVSEQTSSIGSTLNKHLTLVRMLFVLMQRNRQNSSQSLINNGEFKFNFNKIEPKLNSKVKYFWNWQIEERVNPHSQFCAHKPRFRP